MFTLTLRHALHARATGPAPRAPTTRRRPALEGLEDRCLLSNTVINFDDPARTPGEVLSTQYDSKGVDFLGPDRPVIASGTNTHPNSGANVAVARPASEFEYVHLRGSFTKTSHSFVQVAVGKPYSPAGGLPEVLTLYAYDSNDPDQEHPVAQSSPATVYPNGVFQSILSVTSPKSNIASFAIYARPVDTGAALGIDDLTFDNPVAPSPPDFTLHSSYSTATPPIEVGPGQSVTDTIAIQRINGSTGPITFAASGLPNGVKPSFSPSATTSGNQVNLVLTAAPGAATVYGATFTVTATPSASAGSIAHALKQALDVRPDFSVDVDQSAGPNQFSLP
jgi:hypothetical protein